MQNQSRQKWIEKDNSLIKNFKFKNFDLAVKFVNKVAELADSLNHHPDILVYNYNNVKITLTTHSQGAVTSKDIELSKLIDGLVKL